MGYTVGATTSSVNVGGLNLNSSQNKKYALNERRQNDSMHYEEIDYSSIPNDTKYSTKEIDNENATTSRGGRTLDF